MEQMTVTELYTLKETIASEIFAGVTYPWEVLPKIGAFIVKLGSTLPETEYEKIGEDIWLGDEVEVGCGSVLNPGSVIGSHTNIYPLSMVRGVIPAGSIYKKQGEIVAKQ